MAFFGRRHRGSAEDRNDTRQSLSQRHRLNLERAQLQESFSILFLDTRNFVDVIPFLASL